MLSPALLVVFVTSPARVEPTTVPFERAAREVLGPSAELRVEGVPSLLSDADALQRAALADGVVELRWNAARQTAVLHCYIASEQLWVDRTIRFDPADRDPDRGRMLGFAVASMFIDAPRFVQARAAEPPRNEPVSAPLTAGAAPAPATASPIASSSDSATERSSVGDDAESRGPAPLPGQGGPHSLEFAGVATTGLGGSSAAEVGALAALGVPVLGPVTLRLQLEGREGEIAAAQATVQRAIAGVGLVWNTLPEASRVELRLRADALGSWFQVSHLSSDDVASVKNHGWLFGADAVATLGYRVSSSLSLSGGVGVEAMFGQTHVFTYGVERATLPALRGLAELGFLTHF
jgi:hypothetical protein